MRIDITETATGQTTSAAEVDRPWIVHVVCSPDERIVGQRIAVGEELVFGRESLGPIAPIADPRLSRRHVRFTSSEDGLSIADQKSHNGLFVDGKRERAKIVTGSTVVRAGDTVLLLERTALRGPAVDDRDNLLIGEAPIFLEACAKARAASASALSVLLLGETGVGKEVFARATHRWARRSGELVAVNMAALPEQLAESQLFGHVRGAFSGATADAAGLFVQANDGTLFLDEVGELSYELQPKLLRVLEEREVRAVGATRARSVDVRVVSATNADLHREVTAGLFRRDLYARLAGVVIHVPPLRARRSDIVELAKSFLTRPLALSAGWIEAALLHRWSMNVRALRTVMARHELLETECLQRKHFHAIVSELAPAEPSEVDSSPLLSRDKTAPTRPTREELVAALQRFDGNVSQTAKHFGRDTKQIYRWLEKESLVPQDFRRDTP